MIRVLIADDHQVVRSGLEQLLATADDIELVAMAADGAEAVALVEEHAPDIVLMDLSMPNLDEDHVRKELREQLQAAKGCCLELIMKDNHTLGKNPRNLTRWVEIAREEIAAL